MRKALILIPCIAVALAFGADPNYQQPSHETLKALIPTQPSAHCVSQDGLPDSNCTPGAVLTSDVDAICHGVSTKNIRPASWYTNQLKVAQIVEYGWEDAHPSDYEEDHLVSLEIGGHPYDPKNLWPEPHGGDYGSEEKDKVENWLHSQICSGAMTPKEAQDGIMANWKQYVPHVKPYIPRVVNGGE
jgi:hypothetical protein